METGTDYKPTQEEIRQFGIHSKYGKNITDKPKDKVKPLNGKLVLIEGKNETTIPNAYDKPWALLNKIKSDMVKNGYNSKNLKLKNL